MERKIDLKSNGIMPKQIVYDTHTNSLQLNYAPPVEFKIGDKVRLKKNLDLMPGYNYGNTEYTPSMDSIKNAILTVERISNSTGSLDCTNNINNDWWWYKPEWLEHVVENPGPKFKIGDKVVVKNIKGGSRSISENTFVSTMRQFIGNTYTINYVFDDGDVRLEGCGSYVFAEEWLETLLENSIRRYEVGDILQCIDHPAVFILGDFPEFPEDGYSAIAGLTASGKLIFNTDYVWGNLDTVRLATYDEKKVLLNALARQGKEFNPDTLEIEDIKPEFKKGDIVISRIDQIGIFDSYHMDVIDNTKCFDTIWMYSYIHETRLANSGWIAEYFKPATHEEKQILFDALKKEGKRWNKETLEIEPIVEFKTGDKVRFKKGLVLEVGKRYNGLTYPIEIHNTREDILKVLDNDNFERGLRCYNPITNDWWAYLPEWLEHIVEDEVKFKRGDILTAMKTTSDGKDITFVYDAYIIPDKGRGYFKLLCGGVYYHPFEKIKELRNRELKYGFNINNVRYASDKEIEKLDNDLKEIGKKWNRETLQVEDLDISEIVYNLSSACSYLNKPVPDFKSLLLTISNEDFHKYKAQITLQLIREAWNKHDGFEVDYANSEQGKYYPVLDDYGYIKHLISWGYSHINNSCYSFPTKARALQFGNQFKELFKVALGNGF